MKNSIVKKWLILPVCALIVFGLTQLAFLIPAVFEYVYSRGFYLMVAAVMSRISVIVPFSIGDIFYVLLVISMLIVILLAVIRKISFASTWKILLNILAAVYILFYVFWGFNYFRQDLNTRLNLKKHHPDTKEFLVQLKKLIDNTNKSWCTFEKWDKDKVDQQVELSYNKLAASLKINFPLGKRRAKPITASRFFAQAGISGYYGPFFNEIHVNTYILPLEYPFILAHEKAHQFGITNEAEANFYAWLVCTKSNSKQLQYSANLHVLQYFLFQGYRLEEYPEIIKNLDGRVKNDLKLVQENWKKLRNEKIDKAASKVNDFYLKTNKIKSGIEEYSGVVKFVMDYSYDSRFRQKYDSVQ